MPAWSLQENCKHHNICFFYKTKNNRWKNFGTVPMYTHGITNCAWQMEPKDQETTTAGYSFFPFLLHISLITYCSLIWDMRKDHKNHIHFLVTVISDCHVTSMHRQPSTCHNSHQYWFRLIQFIPKRTKRQRLVESQKRKRTNLLKFVGSPIVSLVP